MSMQEVATLHKKSTEFAKDFYDVIEGSGTDFDWFLERKEYYFKPYPIPELRIVFLEKFMEEFSRLVKEHEPSCSNPDDCILHAQLFDINIYVKNEISELKKLAQAKIEAQNNSTVSRTDFLRKAWESALEYSPSTPYSVQVNTEGICEALGIGRDRAVRYLTELDDLGYVKNYLGVLAFQVTTVGAFFLEEETKQPGVLAASLKKEVQDAVGKSKHLKALDLLLAHFEHDEDSRHSVLVLKSRLSQNRKSEINGTVSNDELSKGLNQIAKAILTLSEEIED